MILGMSLSTFTFLHVVISLVGIASGLIVVYGFIAGKRLDIWTALFLLTTVLTSATGFLFPFKHLLPSHIVGGLSLLVLAVAIVARYPRHLEGGWRRTYVVCAMVALYLNCFVLVVQCFLKASCVACIGSQRQRAAVPHRSACTPGGFCPVDDCRGQEIPVLALGSCFQSNSSEGQSRLMKPPSGQRLRSVGVATGMDGVRIGYSAATADPSTALRSGRDDKGRAATFRKDGDSDGRSWEHYCAFLPQLFTHFRRGKPGKGKLRSDEHLAFWRYGNGGAGGVARVFAGFGCPTGSHCRPYAHRHPTS